MVLRVCRQILPTEQDAEDAAQATFLVLARRAHTIGRRDSVPSWLHGVALRVAANARTAAIRRCATSAEGVKRVPPCKSSTLIGKRSRITKSGRPSTTSSTPCPNPSATRSSSATSTA